MIPLLSAPATKSKNLSEWSPAVVKAENAVLVGVLVQRKHRKESISHLRPVCHLEHICLGVVVFVQDVQCQGYHLVILVIRQVLGGRKSLQRKKQLEKRLPHKLQQNLLFALTKRISGSFASNTSVSVNILFKNF